MSYFKKIMLKMLVITFFITIVAILMEMNHPSIEIAIIVLLSIIGAIATFISIMFDAIFRIPRELKQKHKGIKNNDIYINDSDIKNVFYEQGIKLENKRKEAIKYLIIMCVTFFSLMICNLACIELNSILRSIILFILFFLFVIIWIKYENKKNEYTLYYKENIVNELLKSIDTSIQYNPNGDEDNYERFIDAGFIEPKYNKYIITDTITKNKIDNNFVLNNIKLINKGYKSTHLVDYFVFSYIKTNSVSLIQINVRRNSKKNEVDVDTSNFEKFFISDFENSQNDFKLIDNIKNVIIEFYNKYNIDLNLKIKDNNIYIKFYIGNLLETPFILKKGTDVNTFKSNYCIMKEIIEFCNKLKNVVENED